MVVFKFSRAHHKNRDKIKSMGTSMFKLQDEGSGWLGILAGAGFISFISAMCFYMYLHPPPKAPKVELVASEWQCVESKLVTKSRLTPIGKTVVSMPYTESECIAYKRR